MAARIRNITFDCDDVLKMAAFWSAVLPSAAHSTRGSTSSLLPSAAPTQSAGARAVFNKVPQPKQAKNRAYLDLVNPAVSPRRALGHGATVVGEHQLPGGTHRWTVMQDPEGNEFCIAAKASPAGG